MDEEKEKSGTSENTGEGDKSQSTRLIDDTNLAAKRLEDANAERARLLQREEELEARRRLGGVSEAGQETKPKEETPKEYADRIMRGE